MRLDLSLRVSLYISLRLGRVAWGITVHEGLQMTTVKMIDSNEYHDFVRILGDQVAKALFEEHAPEDREEFWELLEDPYLDIPHHPWLEEPFMCLQILMHSCEPEAYFNNRDNEGFLEAESYEDNLTKLVRPALRVDLQEYFQFWSEDIWEEVTTGTSSRLQEEAEEAAEMEAEDDA